MWHAESALQCNALQTAILPMAKWIIWTTQYFATDCGGSLVVVVGHWWWSVIGGSLQSQHWLYSDSDVNPLANHCPLETHCEPTGNPLETHWKPTVKPLATHRLPTHWGWEVAPRATNRWGDGHRHTWSFSSSVGSIWSSWSIWFNRAMWLVKIIIKMRTLRARSALNSI